MQTPISHAQTGLLKYSPLIIFPLVVLFGLLTGDKVTVVIFSVFAITIGLMNFFVVEAWVDQEAIYIKQWRTFKKYSFDKLDKIGELKSGVTDITILTEGGSSRTFLILNPTESFYSMDSANVYDLLMKLKLNYSKNSKSTE